VHVSTINRFLFNAPADSPCGGGGEYHFFCFLLSAAGCLLSAVCFLLSAVCCPQSAVSAASCLLSAVYCLLFAVCCLLSAVCCLLFLSPQTHRLVVGGVNAARADTSLICVSARAAANESYIVATQLLHCCCTVVTLWLHFCYTIVRAHLSCVLRHGQRRTSSSNCAHLPSSTSLQSVFVQITHDPKSSLRYSRDRCLFCADDMTVLD
jgi:hypothetical protein